MKNRVATEVLFVKSMKPHYHESEAEIVLVLSGEVTVHKIERQIRLGEGQFTFVNRRILHYISSEAGAFILSARIVLKEFQDIFSRMEYVEFMGDYDRQQSGQHRPLAARKAAIVVDFLVMNHQMQDQPQRSKDKWFYEEQMLRFLFDSYQLSDHVKAEEEHISQEMADRYYMVAEYVSRNIHKKIRMEDVLRTLYMNAAYFSQFMKKVGGIGFKEFVSYRKLIMISMLLIDERYSLREIAELVDMTDMKAFHSNFKKCFKTSPAKWRERLLQIQDDFEVCTDGQVLESYIQRHRINRHRDNTILKNLRHVIACKEQGISLKDVEVVIAPYADMDGELDDDYQVYKFSETLFRLIQETEAKVVMVYPVRIVKEEIHSGLMIHALKSFIVSFGIHEIRRWKIVFQAGNAAELAEAERLRARLAAALGALNIQISLMLEDG